MLAVIRLRGVVGVRTDIEDTLKMLSLRRKHALVVLPRTSSILGMIKKVDFMITWGELDDELLKEFSSKKAQLKPPPKGFRAIKKHYPKGDLGYRGKEINELIKKMMVN